MADVVVTVPMPLWEEWKAEGCLPGERCPRGYYYYFSVPTRPRIEPGERVYIVAHGRLRGYAPLCAVEDTDFFHRPIAGGLAESLPPSPVYLVREGGARAVTIDEPIKGFQGYRYRWWERPDERPFPGWEAPDAR